MRRLAASLARPGRGNRMVDGTQRYGRRNEEGSGKTVHDAKKANLVEHLTRDGLPT